MILAVLRRLVTAKWKAHAAAQTEVESGGADDVYTNLIEKVVQDERDRKKSFEDRGLTVVSSSGGLITLVAAVAALAPGGLKSGVPDSARTLVFVALVSFVVAAVLGLSVTFPLNYAEPTPDGLERLLEEPFWTGRAFVARRARSNLALDVLRAARDANKIKGRLLMAGIAAEVFAVGLLAVAVGGTIRGIFS
jgi:hypothetical protein